VPWGPELFSAPVLARLEEKWQRERLDAVPYYDGLMSGEHDALIGSFAGEPVLHDPLHGRVRGARELEAYVSELKAWLAQHNMSFEPVDDVITETRAFEEVVLHVEGQAGASRRSIRLCSPQARPSSFSQPLTNGLSSSVKRKPVRLP
jgi:hypothetical protein